MIRKKGVASLQIVLLISFSFAVAFIIDAGMVIGQPETVIVASRVPPSFETGSYFNIPIEGEGIQTVKWLGEKDGIQNGILSNGDKVTWPNIDPANIQLAEVGGFQDAAFGKTLEFGGGKFDAITAINKPETIPGLLDNGKITAEGAKALESQLGVKNAAVSSGGQLISGQASAGIYEYSPFGQDFLSIGGEGSIFGAAGGYVAHLAQGAVWAGVAYGAIQLIGGLLDLEEGLTDALSYGFAGGLFAYKTAYGIAAGGAQTIPVGSTLGPFVPWIGLGVGIAIFVLTYKKQKRELVRFECLAWEAPLGGESCELCNEDPNIPCSEYRCKSLGQGCELENVGTENEVCIWMNEFDVSAPKITPWDDALSPSGLEYVPDSAISPPNRGFKLLRRPEGCLAPFTPLEFGIITDEPAQCRVDYEPKDNFDDMQFLLGESTLFLEEHTQTLKVQHHLQKREMEGRQKFIMMGLIHFM